MKDANLSMFYLFIHIIFANGIWFKIKRDKDRQEFIQQTESKPYEFNLNIKITDMNQLIADLKTLVKNNWKILLFIVLVVFLLSNYNEIKSGFVDGWNRK